VRRTARPSLLLAGGLGMLVAGFLPISLLGELISTGTLIAFATVCAAVIRLRLVEPGRARPFRVPLFWLTASLGIAACLFLLASMGWFAFVRIATWQVAGLVVLASSMLLARRA
jgi:APA family basic amino acid/polyamine antiporter